MPELEPASPGSRRLQGFKINFREVSKVLQSLDMRKSVVPNGVSLRLFQKVGKSGKFPSSWKVAWITPVFYKNIDASLKNYWPMSVLPTLATTFERVLMSSL